MITVERIEERSLRRPPVLSADQTVLLPNGGYPAQAAPLAKREASEIPSGSSTPPRPSPQGGGSLTRLALGKLVEQAVLGRPDGRLGTGAQVQLAQDVRNIMLHGLIREKEIRGDLLVRLALGGQPQHALLLLRKGRADDFVRACRHLADAFQDFSRHFGVEQGATLGYGYDGVDQRGLIYFF